MGHCPYLITLTRTFAEDLFDAGTFLSAASFFASSAASMLSAIFSSLIMTAGSSSNLGVGAAKSASFFAAAVGLETGNAPTGSSRGETKSKGIDLEGRGAEREERLAESGVAEREERLAEGDVVEREHTLAEDRVAEREEKHS